MRFQALVFAIGVLGLPAIGHAQQAAPRGVRAADSAAVADPKDVGSLDGIMKAVYDVISGPAGQKRNWGRMRSLFVVGARLGASGRLLNGNPLGDLNDWIRGADAAFATMPFFEREISRKVEAFGHIAHVFSTYESLKAPGEQPFARGINSFQLLNDGTRWWVVSIYWDAERPDNPIPPKYLERTP